MKQIPFATSGSIPAVGLGTWPMDDAECETAVASAIDLGYRLVDTAYAYGNEVGVGRGVAASSVPREDVFVTTKFNKEWHSVAGVAETTEASLRRLGLDYLDLLLVHWPNPDQDRYVEAWEGFIAVRDRGLVRHVGVSNFLPEHTERIIAATGVAPELDQLQINPRWTQPAARAFNAEHGIVTQAWRPLGMGGDLLELPAVTGLAAKLRRHSGAAARRLVRRPRPVDHAEVGRPGASGAEPRRGRPRARGRRRRGALGAGRNRARRHLAPHVRPLTPRATSRPERRCRRLRRARVSRGGGRGRRRRARCGPPPSTWTSRTARSATSGTSPVPPRSSTTSCSL